MRPTPQPASQEPGAEACRHCGVIDRPTLTQGAGPHALRASCGSCGRFLRWISLLAPSERLARRMKARLEAMMKYPPSQAQLQYLRKLGDKAAAPETMGEASQRIEALKSRVFR
jgi:hypothetical protein